jgi:glutathione S-transferase
VRIYDTRRSGNAWKVRLLAGLLGIALERRTLSIDRGDLRTPSFRALNPLAQVPVLELDDGRTISESIAILQYLARGTPWWPDEPFDQAQVLMWLSFEQSRHMRPLAELRLHLCLRRDRTPGDGDMVRFRAEAGIVLGLLDAQLARQGGVQWVATADMPSIADVALYPYTRLAPMGGIDLGRFSHLAPWFARIERLKGYQSLFPDRDDLVHSTSEEVA